MNRKERRIKQSQDQHEVVIQLRGRTYTIAEAGALAVQEHNLRNFQTAVDIYDRILAKVPDYADVYNNRGVTLKEMKRYDEALTSYDKAIALNPNHANAYNNRGIALKEMKRYGEALASVDRAIALNPDCAEIYNNRGLTLYEMHQYNDALASYDKAIALNPDYREAYENRGAVLQKMTRYGEALVSYDKAITLHPNHANAYNNRGVTLKEMQRYGEAMASYDKAIALNPDYGDAYYNKGLLKLLLADFEEGWKLYEWRWKKSDNEEARTFRQPLWLGDASPAGKTILLYAEQGLGDTIQFCRYVPRVEALGAKVILGVRTSLIGLISTLKGSYRLVAEGSPLPAFDLHCPLMSLPLAFKTLVNTIPSDIPYLFVDPHKQKIWRERLGTKMKPRVGLVWSGSATNKNDHNRSIAPNLLAPLLHGNFDFHSIQKEYRLDDAAVLAGQNPIISHAADLKDFADTAALISEMDLIISVDTSVVHLAGALGKPVWVLLPFAPDFRWMTEREDSPWYPTARLFRQTSIGDWKGVIAKVKAQLEAQPIQQAQAKNETAIHFRDRSYTIEEAGVLAVQEHNLGNLQTAVEIYDLILAQVPGYAEVHNNRGGALQEMERYDEALASYDKAIVSKPDYAEAHNNRGTVLQVMHRYKDALASCDKAIALKPDYSEAYSNRGLTLKEIMRYGDALVSFDKALALKPDYAKAYYNRGVTLQVMKQYDDALASYDKAIALNPDYTDAYWDKSWLKLLLGEYEEGWKLYEWRWKKIANNEIRTFQKPLWLGYESLVNKTILLYPEQGLGDAIQFCRYAAMVEALGAKVIVEVPSSLMGLMSTLKGAFHVVEQGKPLPEFDLHCPLMSLPLAFKTLVNTIPSDIPYLFVDPHKQKIWRERLGTKIKPRVGLVWSGSATNKNDHNRSIALHLFSPLWHFNADFHSIQTEVRPDDAAVLAQQSNIISHADDLKDFADTAALISEMDLIISVDTSVVHLAGALGKPVWVLLPFAPDFRWMTEREDSPWYPTARLFRQTSIGDWASLIARAADELKYFAAL